MGCTLVKPSSEVKVNIQAVGMAAFVLGVLLAVGGIFLGVHDDVPAQNVRHVLVPSSSDHWKPRPLLKLLNGPREEQYSWSDVLDGLDAIF